VQKDTSTVKTTIRPTYLNIQSGANAGDRTPVRLFNLITTDGFAPVTSEDADSESWDAYCSAFDAENGLKDLDSAVKLISKVRSYYGAISNRLDHTYDNNLNYAENLQSAESLIRDTDMALEMTNFTKNSILMQAAQAMISQANSNAQSVLSLLS
jgi:flagellin